MGERRTQVRIVHGCRGQYISGSASPNLFEGTYLSSEDREDDGRGHKRGDKRGEGLRPRINCISEVNIPWEHAPSTSRILTSSP